MVGLLGVIVANAQAPERLASTDWVRDGQTFLCRYELLTGGAAKDRGCTLTCQQSPTAGDEFGLGCFMNTDHDRAAFVCPVTPPMPFVAGKGPRLECESTPTKFQAEMRRALMLQGLPLSTPIPTLKCSAEKFDVAWSDEQSRP